MDKPSKVCWNLPLPAGGINLANTLDCGQAFRWRLVPEEGCWIGAARNRILRLQVENGSLILYAEEADRDFWRGYLDLDRDYGAIHRVLARDPVLAGALADCPGMRILRQEPWEAVCTFIISANNNIPRIRGIVERLCQGFGAPLGEGLFGFPAPEALAALGEEALAPLRAGYRTGYILEAARQVARGEVDLAKIAGLPTPEAAVQLKRLRGVGDKVAACVLLFGYGRLECVPVDVWIGRVMARLYPGGWPEEILPWAGVAQQLLFHHIRRHPMFGL